MRERWQEIKRAYAYYRSVRRETVIESEEALRAELFGNAICGEFAKRRLAGEFGEQGIDDAVVLYCDTLRQILEEEDDRRRMEEDVLADIARLPEGRAA